MHRVIIVTKIENEIVAVHYAMENVSKRVLQNLVRWYRKEGMIDDTMTIIWEVV